MRIALWRDDEEIERSGEAELEPLSPRISSFNSQKEKPPV